MCFQVICPFCCKVTAFLYAFQHLTAFVEKRKINKQLKLFLKLVTPTSLPNYNLPLRCLMKHVLQPYAFVNWPLL